jgi:hypothetical protein
MLPQVFQFVVVNNSGQTLTFSAGGRLNMKVTRWFIDPATGLIDYTQDADSDMNFGSGSIVNGAEVVGPEYDNTSGKYLGAQVQLEVTHDEGTAANGTFDVYLSVGDESGKLTADADGYDSAEQNRITRIDTLRWHEVGVDDEVMRANGASI